MPQNKSSKRGKNSKARGSYDKGELVFKEDGQEYALVIRLLGCGRLEAFCYDGSTRISHIRGKMRKRQWINNGDLILVGLREYQDKKADVIHKYRPEEARKLLSYGELPKNARINMDPCVEVIDEDDLEGGFVFDEI